MLDLFTQQILPVLLGVLGTAITAFTVYLFKQLIDYVKIKVLEEALYVAKQETREILISVFAQLQEDVKRKAKEDGLTREDINQIKENVINKLKTELPNLLRKILEETIDDFEGLIGDWIEGFINFNDFLD